MGIVNGRTMFASYLMGFIHGKAFFSGMEPVVANKEGYYREYDDCVNFCAIWKLFDRGEVMFLTGTAGLIRFLAVCRKKLFRE